MVWLDWLIPIYPYMQKLMLDVKNLTVFDEYRAWDGSPSEVLFHMLYNWHCKKPKATKKDLALMVRECHPCLFNHAIDLDPNCELI
jgi:hypothetical protein